MEMILSLSKECRVFLLIQLTLIRHMFIRVAQALTTTMLIRDACRGGMAFMIPGFMELTAGGLGIARGMTPGIMAMAAGMVPMTLGSMGIEDGMIPGIMATAAGMAGVILTMDIGEYITLIMVILALLTTGATLQEVLGISQGQEHIMTMVSQVIRLPVII